MGAGALQAGVGREGKRFGRRRPYRGVGLPGHRYAGTNSRNSRPSITGTSRPRSRRACKCDCSAALNSRITPALDDPVTATTPPSPSSALLAHQLGGPASKRTLTIMIADPILLFGARIPGCAGWPFRPPSRKLPSLAFDCAFDYRRVASFLVGILPGAAAHRRGPHFSAFLRNITTMTMPPMP